MYVLDTGIFSGHKQFLQLDRSGVEIQNAHFPGKSRVNPQGFTGFRDDSWEDCNGHGVCMCVCTCTYEHACVCINKYASLVILPFGSSFMTDRVESNCIFLKPIICSVCLPLTYIDLLSVNM